MIACGPMWPLLRQGLRVEMIEMKGGDWKLQNVRFVDITFGQSWLVAFASASLEFHFESRHTNSNHQEFIQSSSTSNPNCGAVRLLQIVNIQHIIVPQTKLLVQFLPDLRSCRGASSGIGNLKPTHKEM